MKNPGVPANRRDVIAGVPANRGTLHHVDCGGEVVPSTNYDNPEIRCTKCPRRWNGENVLRWADGEFPARFYVLPRVDTGNYTLVEANEGKKAYTELVPTGLSYGRTKAKLP